MPEKTIQNDKSVLEAKWSCYIHKRMWCIYKAFQKTLQPPKSPFSAHTTFIHDGAGADVIKQTQQHLPSRTKQVHFSSRNLWHWEHLRQAACHSKLGATRKMYWSWIWPPQPTHVLILRPEPVEDDTVVLLVAAAVPETKVWTCEKRHGVKMAESDTSALMASFKHLPINGYEEHFYSGGGHGVAKNRPPRLLIFFPPSFVFT